MGNTNLPEPKKFIYKGPSKEEIKTVKDQPYINLSSGVNYIKENIKTNARLVPPRPRQPVDWTQKKNYGSVPPYLTKI